MLNLSLELTAIYEPGCAPQVDLYDLANSKMQFLLLVSFGNGIYEEVRIRAHSSDAMLCMIGLLKGGGYGFGDPADVLNRALYQAGDAVLPAHSPFIFLDPVLISGEPFDFAKVAAGDTNGRDC